MILRKILLAVLVAAAAGCKPNTPPPQSSSAAEGPAAAVAVDKSSDNGMLSVSPGVANECGGPSEGMSAQVKWDASSVQTQGVEVWLQAPGEDKKLWSAGGVVGESKTGPWLRPGSMIFLINGENDQELAKIEITAAECG